MLITELGEESFGERFTRARGKHRLGLKEAAERVSRYVPISSSTLSRLENLGEPPSARRPRSVAALYALVLGYHPAVFGLSVDDLPPGLKDHLLPDGEVSPESGPRQGFDGKGCSPSGPAYGAPELPVTPSPPNGLKVA